MEIILVSIGGPSVLLFAIGFLVRSLIAQLLEKDLTVFKSNLEKIAYEHQVRFSQLHEIRVQSIANLYACIVTLVNEANNFVKYAVSTDEETNNKHLNQLWSAADDFKKFFDKNRIYYSEDICVKIDELNNSLSTPISKLVMNIESFPKANELGELVTSWKNATNELDSKTPALKHEIQSEFRKMLGVI